MSTFPEYPVDDAQYEFHRPGEEGLDGVMVPEDGTVAVVMEWTSPDGSDGFKISAGSEPELLAMLQGAVHALKERKVHRYVVEVSTATREQANKVMRNLIGEQPDEGHGFDAKVEWRSGD